MRVAQEDWCISVYSTKDLSENLCAEVGLLGQAQATTTRFQIGVKPRYFFKRLYHLPQLFVLLASLLIGIGSLIFNPFPLVVNAEIPICSNSVSGGVYQDANANNIHEPDEPFLAGAIQVVNSANLTVETLQSPDGLFALSNLACDQYTVYHNGDYVGKLFVDEVMGEVLIEWPKTNLTQHIYIPIIN